MTLEPRSPSPAGGVVQFCLWCALVVGARYLRRRWLSPAGGGQMGDVSARIRRPTSIYRGCGRDLSRGGTGASTVPGSGGAVPNASHPNLEPVPDPPAAAVRGCA